MPKDIRLTRKDSLRLKGRRLHGEFFIAIVSSGPRTKVACIVTKKIAAKASARNLIKRRTRAAIPKTLPKGTVFILQAKREAAGASFTEMQLDIERIMKNIAFTHGA